MALDLATLLTTATSNLAAPEAELAAILDGMGDGSTLSIEKLYLLQTASMKVTLTAEIASNIMKAIAGALQAIGRNVN